MKYFLPFFFFLKSSAFLFSQELKRCSDHTAPLTSEEIHRKIIFEGKIEQYLAANSKRRLENEQIYTIPVVVHVIYNTESQRVSYEQVLSQMQVLNLDYRHQNADSTKTPIAFKPIVGDANIKFVLAKRDPAGLPTDGVTYTHTATVDFNDTDQMKFSSSGGKNAWDPTKYLNIWVCNMRGGILGYFPYPMNAGSSADGVVVSYRAFGTVGNLSPNYNRGRTATHEIGHWFGLYHPWGPPRSAICTSDDVEDTPSQENSSTGCPSFPYIDAKCNNGPNGRLYCNFMDYSYDACMNMFTKGQVARMRAVLTSERLAITNSSGHISPFRYDLAVQQILLDTAAICQGYNAVPKVMLINYGRDTILSYILSLTIKDQILTRTWNGKLAPNEDTLWQFDEAIVLGNENRLEAVVEMVQPTDDEYLANNRKVVATRCSIDLAVYPNPAQGKLYIRGNNPKVASSTFYNVAGSQVLKVDLPSDVDISSLGAGFYLVILETDKGQLRRQLIIVR